MKVAIHQPQYLPWVPYFLKIEESDLFILLDTVDFEKNGLQNRNQIKTAQGEHWLTVPVKQKLGQKICDVEINNHVNWRYKHWQTIKQCYKKAAAFHVYEDEMESLYAKEWSRLNELNIEIIKRMLLWMNIKTQVIMSSQMKARGNASQLVLNLCLEVGATQYLSGIGGKNYLEPDAFAKAGVELCYRPPVFPTAYPQLFPQSGPQYHLSALDMILNCGTSWRDYIHKENVGFCDALA